VFFEITFSYSKNYNQNYPKTFPLLLPKKEVFLPKISTKNKSKKR